MFSRWEEWLTRQRRALAHLPTGERKRLEEQVRPGVGRWWRLPLVGIMSNVPLLAVASLGGGNLATVIAIALAGGVVALVYCESQRQRRELSRLLLAENLRPAVCLICGYDLRGSTAEQCPECGEALASGADLEKVDPAGDHTASLTAQPDPLPRRA